MASDDVRFLVFDIESVPDSSLVSWVRSNGEQDPHDALEDFQHELEEKNNSNFVPYTFQTPVSIAIAKVNSQYSLLELVVLKADERGVAEIAQDFWKGWRHYNYPQFVTFNGRGFDIPLMELMAFKYGIAIPEWFDDSGPAYQQKRYRYNSSSHFDLQDFLTNYGATTFRGGQNLAAKLIKLPGKMDTRSDMVQELYETGKMEEIHSYCRCDVLDAYLLFLRIETLRGRIQKEWEAKLHQETKTYLANNANKVPIYKKYLDTWERICDYYGEDCN
jgi:predicted PolB exonuclease-like 3'-5' exonuclease